MPRRPTPGVITTKLDMTGAPKQGPSKDMQPTPGSLTPKPMVHGDNLGGDEPQIEPVQGPNKAFSEGKYDK